MHILNFEQWFLLATGLILFAIIYNIIQTILFFVKKKRNNPTVMDTPPNLPLLRGGIPPLDSPPVKGRCHEVTEGIKEGLGEVKITLKENVKFIIKKLINLFDKLHIPLLNLLFIVPAIIIFWKLFSPVPQIEYTYPSENELWTSYEKPVEIVFDRPILAENLEYHMSPEAKGDWVFKPCFPFLPFTRTLQFYPSESFWPNEKIMIYVSNIGNQMNKDKGNEYLLEFESVSLPKITQLSVEDTAENIPVNSEVEFYLNQEDGPHNQWEIIIEPEVEYELNLLTNTDIHQITFPNGLKQSTTYSIKIFQKAITYNTTTKEIISEGESELVKELSFTTVKAPLISSFAPEGGSILPNAAITMNFDDEMDKPSVEDNFSVSPEVLGEFSWSDDGKVLTFTPELLNKNTDYAVKLAKGMKSVIGGITISEISYTFKTVSNVIVQAINPGPDASGVSVNSSVAVTFDQPVNHVSAESKFSIQPHIQGAFSWSGNTLTFNPNANLNYNQSYQTSLASGIKSIHGYDSQSNFVYHFTAEPELIMIYTEWDKQDTDWTCNFAAAKMALALKGVYVNENALVNIATRQPGAVYNSYNIVGGGNPHKGFVNSYGTYWEPVSKAVSAYRSNTVKSGWTLAEVCTEISKGNPIVTWGQNGWSNDRTQSWTAADGTHITGFSGMHSVTIVGCLGDINNPSHIYIQDPWRNQEPWRKGGTELTAAEFLRRWSYFGNTGMVVY